MTLMDTLARAEAVATGRAVAAATVRHRHLAGKPLVLVPLTTAGEAGAPLGALVGTEREAPELLVVPQPLDREMRFGFFAGLAAVMLPLLESYGDEVKVEAATRNREETEVCADALQIVVPNGAALEYVRLLGRSTRFLRTVEDPDAPHPVPVPVPLLGRWLTHYGERARTSGSALLVAMTDLLTRHWASGQSAMEDQHLGALLGWIDPTPGLDGPAAAARAQTGRGPDGLLFSPPAGPATDPVFDNRVLAPAMARYDKARTAVQALGVAGVGIPDQRQRADRTPAPARAAAEAGPDARRHTEHGHGSAEAPRRTEHRPAGPGARERAGLAAAEAEVRRLVESQLRPTWEDVWHGIDLLRALPEGAHVAERWKRDRWSFTGHRDRVRAGEPPQPKRDDAITAAQKLAGRETAQARLLAQEALDDPLAMAARRLTGEAFAGRVVAVGMAFSDGKRPMPRPLVTLATSDLPQAEPGGRAYRALPGAKSAQTGELVTVERVEDAPGTPTATAAITGTDRHGTPDGPGDPATGPAAVRDDLPGTPAEPDAVHAPAWHVTVRLTGGMGSGRTPKEGSVPAVGDTVCFTLFEHEPRSGPALPEGENTPWTHGGPPGGAAAPEEPDAVTAEDYL
ncbi:hypothetical protein [Streptomyces sp.]|uniref:hypothetical protein n=1 Tax=Streptomyces sp. TaxID=1931 RepID=UPI002F40BF06